MIPFNIRTHYSILESTVVSKDLVKYVDIAFGVSDHNNLGGYLQLSSDAEKAGKQAFLGITLNITEKPANIKEDNPEHEIVLYALNKRGWFTLIRILSEANNTELYNDGPRVDLSLLREFVTEDIICITGFYRSEFYNRVLEESFPDLVTSYKEIFGDRLYIGITLTGVSDHENRVEKLRSLPIQSVAFPEVRYLDIGLVDDYRLIQCIQRKMKFEEAIAKTNRDSELEVIMHNNLRYYPDSFRIEKYTKEEIENTYKLAGLFEPYSILSNPRLPKFPCPSGMSEIDYLKELCRVGWRKLLMETKLLDTPEKFKKYTEIIQMELEVIEEANLAGYFLIVADITRWCKEERGWFICPGRGSAAGSLIAYLLGITLVDPIPNNLLFARFYNKGRAVDGQFTLPDIDIDFPVNKRGEVIQYLRDKYGEDKIAHICTYGTLKGKQAITEAFRIKNILPFSTIKNLTDSLPEEQKVMDKMEEFFEKDEDKSLILWTLHNEPEIYKEYCRIENDELIGEYAHVFKQAIRIEGLVKSVGQHASGIVISDVALSEISPMIRTSIDDMERTGFDMVSGEKAGLVKLDILGSLAVSKINSIKHMLLTGRFKEY